MNKIEKRTRQHNYDDYEPEIDICYDRVQITNKQNPLEYLTGWMGINYLDDKSFIFEYVDVHSDTGYIREVLNYMDWAVKCLGGQNEKDK